MPCGTMCRATPGAHEHQPQAPAQTSYSGTLDAASPVAVHSVPVDDHSITLL